MRSSICRPGLVGRVEDGRRDLADAAAEAGLELAVDDHRRLLEALLGRALAGRAVEGERLARRDQRAVDQLRDERDVVQPARDAAVGRVVAADDARDPHRLRLGGRALGRRRAHGERVRSAPSARRRRGEERLRGRRHVDARGRACRGRSGCRRGVDRERRVDRRVLDGLAQLRSNQASAPGPAIASSVAPPTGRLSSSAIRQRGSFQRVPSYSSRTGADSAIRAWRGGGRELGGRHLDRIDAAPAARPAGRARAARATRTTRSAAAFCVELPTGLAGHDVDAQARAGPASPRRASGRSCGRARRACSREPRRRPAPGGTISEPKNRVCSRLKPRTGPKPSPSRAAVSTAVAQSASTPSVVALIGNSSPPAVNTTGTCATFSKRRSSSFRASLGVSPPTSTPAICDAVGDPRRRAGEREADQRRQDGEERQR